MTAPNPQPPFTASVEPMRTHEDQMHTPFLISAEMEPAAAVVRHTNASVCDAWFHLRKALDLVAEDHPARADLQKAYSAVKSANERLGWPHVVMSDPTMPIWSNCAPVSATRADEAALDDGARSYVLAVSLLSAALPHAAAVAASDSGPLGEIARGLVARAGANHRAVAL